MLRKLGFTVIELVITLVVTAILLTIVSVTIGDVQQRLSAGEASKTFEALLARARAHAVEGGEFTRLVLDLDGDSASIVRAGQTIETIWFGADLHVDVQAPSASNPVEVCMNPRGYGEPACTSFSSAIELSFVSGPDSKTVKLLPLGQISQ